ALQTGRVALRPYLKEPHRVLPGCVSVVPCTHHNQSACWNRPRWLRASRTAWRLPSNTQLSHYVSFQPPRNVSRCQDVAQATAARQQGESAVLLAEYAWSSTRLRPDRCISPSVA